MIKTFRGRLKGDDAGDQVTIRLATNKGEVGYRIKKFQIIQKTPGILESEGLCQLWQYQQDDASNKLIQFDNSELLGISLYTSDDVANIYPEDSTVIFDRVAINQDIFLTYIDIRTVNDDMNYYIELEQIKLDLNEATVATLKDMRGS